MSYARYLTPTILLLLSSLAAAEPSAEAAPITVVGQHDTNVYPGSSSTANKGKVPTLESPRHVDVISRDLIRDLDATSATELWKLIPNAVESERGTVIVRGFTLDQRPASGAQLFDGVRTSVYNLVPVNLYNIERVEMLKGPDGVMYGQGQPGGVINYVQKKPQRESRSEFSVHADSYGKKQVAIDNGGTIAETTYGDFLYRVNVAAEQTDTFKKDETFKNFRAAPAFSWLPGESTTLTLLTEMFKDRRTGGRGYGTPVRQGDLFAMPRDYTINDPNDFRETRGGDAQLQLNQKLTPDLSFDANLFASRCWYTNQYHEGMRNAAEDAANNPVYRRQYRNQTSDTKTYGYDLHVIWDKKLEDWSHRLLVGTDLTRLIDPQFPAITAANTNPVSGTNSDGASNYNLDNPYTVPTGIGAYGVDSSTDGHGKYLEIGGYANYRLGWREQVFLDLGMRHDDFRQHSWERNRLTNTVNYDVSSRDNHLNYDGGLVWKFVPQASVYYGYSTGLSAQGYTTIGNANGPFDPLEWDQHEVGLNAESPDKQLGASLAIFRINRKHDLVPDTRPGAPTGAQIDIGETQSEGVEVSIRGKIANNTTLSLSYGYDLATVEKSTQVSTFSGKKLEGEKLAGVPQDTANISLGHTLNRIPVRLFAGCSYMGARKARLDPADPLNLSLPGYYTVDVAATYLQPSWQGRLGVTNLLDRDYAVFYRSPGHQVNRGEPQTLTASFTAWF